MNHYCPGCGHRLSRIGYRCGCGHTWTQERFGDFGFDVTDGDLVMGLGGGLGIDLATGGLELEIAPGIDIPLGDGGW